MVYSSTDSKSTYYSMCLWKMQLKGAGNMREKRVDLKIPAYVRETLTALETAGHQAYCVGGCVRDSLLGLDPHDWDLCTSARPATLRGRSSQGAISSPP